MHDGVSWFEKQQVYWRVGGVSQTLQIGICCFVLHCIVRHCTSLLGTVSIYAVLFCVPIAHGCVVMMLLMTSHTEWKY